MNRAVDGDVVAVALLPQDQWQEENSLSLADEGMSGSLPDSINLLNLFLSMTRIILSQTFIKIFSLVRLISIGIV